MPRLVIYVDCADWGDLQLLRDAITFEVDVVIDSKEDELKGKVETGWDVEDDES